LYDRNKKAAGGQPAAFLFSLPSGLQHAHRPLSGCHPAQSTEGRAMSEKKLRRSRQKHMIAGVVGGLAEYFDLDVTVLRIVYVLVSLFSAAFPGIIVYLICWVIMPMDES
jgi:phage shock protein C